MRQSIAVMSCCLSLLSAPLAAQTVFVPQGPSWNNALRSQFYTQDQGARIMPISWMRALTLPNGDGFLGDALARYGYLPMPGRDEADLPVGFTTNGSGAQMAVGMTCSACHTREIAVSGTHYRVDGGPGIVDFQAFLRDLDNAVLDVQKTDAAFQAFAEKVLGANPDPSAIGALKASVEIWSNRFHTLVDRSLPTPSWAPGRLDAVSMIFNRLAGLDLGEEGNDYLIPNNIAVADAPTRYPFLWNAAKQDFTQWPGFAANGNDLLGLSRNLGEVYGVFGDFRPVPQTRGLFDRDYITHNSANWDGLKALESWIWDIGAPQWPWALDDALVTQGQEIFGLSTANGGCIECHGKKRGAFRSFSHSTFATPILDVGTDIRECQILTRPVQTGVLEGSKIPLVGKTLAAEAPAFDVLANSVIGAIVQNAISLRSDADIDRLETAMDSDVDNFENDVLKDFDDLRDAFPVEGDPRALLTPTPEAEIATETPCRYEARVLDGIWAAAPYLHNGSVPTLADLLKSPADRPASFTPGPEYDIDNVGMATSQTVFDQVITTTGCDDRASGNSRCGHDYGTSLSDTQKRALLEYLKSI